MTKLLTTKEKAESLRELLESYRKPMAAMLPRHVTADRVMQVTLNSVRNNPKLLDCTPQSFIGSMLEAAKLGLEVGVAGQAWIIPFKDNKTGDLVATFIPGYRGMVQLAWRSNMIANIYAVAVREKDQFEFKRAPLFISHVEWPHEDSGRLVATYAVAEIKGGGTQIERMRDWEIEKIKKRSPAARSKMSPWNNPDDEPEMWKKTVLRRICKVLPMSIEYNRIEALDDAAESGRPQGLEVNVNELENIVLPTENETEERKQE